MKITKLVAKNFLGARDVDVRLTKPIVLFAGANGAGKSSLQEAVRMALTGESVRVGLKKDYGALVTEGQESGFVEVHAGDSVYSIVLPSGKGMHADMTALPYVLDAQRFARLDPNERRAFLFSLIGLKTDGGAVRERLLAKGCDAAMIEAIAPFLRAGFDAAHKEAQAKAREEKAAWRALTGETYGEKKAEAWEAKRVEVDPAAARELASELAVLDVALAEANQRLGALLAQEKAHAEAAGKLAGLREKAGRYARIMDKLSRDTVELADWKKKLEAARAAFQSGVPASCPHCGGMVVIDGGTLTPYAGDAQSEVSQADLLEIERAVKLLESSVANGQRDLDAADAAAKAISEVEGALDTAPGAADIQAARDTVNDLQAQRAAADKRLQAEKSAIGEAQRADNRTAAARAAHRAVCDWQRIADALAPDGIPGEMLAEALGPINDRLMKSSTDAEWPRIEIQPDMSILAALHERPYTLLSESEKWRADAMIAEAIAHISGVRLLVLDRADVLDLKGRGDLLAWLDALADDGEIDTALVFATLKAAPVNLSDSCATFWIENGVIDEKLSEAA